jgi:dienelactone hydrolase
MKTNRSWLAVWPERITKASHSTQTLVACVATAALLLGIVPSPAGQPLDGGEPGLFPVGHTSILTKGEDQRLVFVDVFYPADARQVTGQSSEARYAAFPYENNSPYMTSSQWEAFGYDRAYEAPAPANGPFPLVIVGTGLGTPGWGYLYFATRLASHGCVVALHDSYKDIIWGPGYGYEWFSKRMYYRPRDMSSALTELLRRNGTRGDLLQKLIDLRYIVAAGHSMGGYAALVEVAGDDQVCDSTEIAGRDGTKNPPTSVCQPTPPDPRFTGLICLDAGSHMLRWEELSRIGVPSLIMGQAYWAHGQYSDRLPIADESYVARPHAAICAQTRAVRVDIALADHYSFADASDGLTILHNAGFISDETFNSRLIWYLPGMLSGSPVLPVRDVHRMITKYAVAWLKAELVKDGSELSKRILTQAYARANEPNVEVYWNEDCNPGGTLKPGTFTYFKDMAPGSCAVGDKNPAGYFIPYP